MLMGEVDENVNHLQQLCCLSKGQGSSAHDPVLTHLPRVPCLYNPHPQFTLSFHTYFFTFQAVTFWHGFYWLFFFPYSGLLRALNNFKEHFANISRSKRSSTWDDPSLAVPSTPLSVLFNIQEATDCTGLFCGFITGLEQIIDWVETIRLIFSWFQPRIWIQAFWNEELKYNWHTVLPLS